MGEYSFAPMGEENELETQSFLLATRREMITSNIDDTSGEHRALIHRSIHWNCVAKSRGILNSFIIF